MKPSTRLFKPESLLNVFQYLPFSFHSVWSFAMGQSITISLRIVTIVYLQKPSGLGLSEKWAYRVGTEIDFLILQICYFVWKVPISLPEYHSIPSCFSRDPRASNGQKIERNVGPSQPITRKEIIGNLTFMYSK